MSQLIDRDQTDQLTCVPAKIGFDANSPAPLIGVKIALTVE